MVLARVVGAVIASRKEPLASGWKLLWVQPLNENGGESGTRLVACDVVGAGEGEVVVVAQGSSARQTKATDQRPSDAVIMGIVDSWDVMGEVRYRKGMDGKDH